MATAAEFKVILTIDSQGNAKIEEVKKALDDVGQSAQQANQGGAMAADEFVGALMRKLGVMALVTAGFYKLEQAAVGAFKAGIQAVDDYKLTTIGVAATLTDMAKDGIDAQKAYAQNIAYSKDMYNDLELAAAKHFASGKELIQGWNILAQKGIVLRKEEIDDLGIIVDKIKLATQGQVQGIQIAQELRAMLSGQSRQTDQMAMILKDRYGAAWEEIVKKHREAGDLLSWLAGEFKGLYYAGQDVQQTLLSQKTTLETLLSQVGRGGLEGAYSDIVGILQQANSYLRDHREEISGGIARGWEVVRDLVGGVKGFLEEIVALHGKWVRLEVQIATSIIGPGATYLSGGMTTLTGAEITNRLTGEVKETGYGTISFGDVFGALGKLQQEQQQAIEDAKRSNLQSWIRESGFSDNTYLSSQIQTGMAGIARAIDVGVKDIKAAKGRADLQLGGVTKLMKDLKASTDFETDVGWLGPLRGAPTKRGASGTEGGGKGRDTADTLENLIMQLRQEQAKLTEGAFADIDAGYVKIIEKIKKLAMDDAQLKEGMLVAAELKAAKEKKVIDDFTKYYDGQMHRTTAAQMDEDLKRLANVKGNLDLEAKAREIMYQHALDRSQKLAQAELQQQKGYYDSLAGASVLLADQVAWKEKSWQIEKEISKLQLEQWFKGKDITENQKNEYRSLLALTNQAKEYNLARQKAVDLGTLEGWAIERSGEALKRDRTSIKNALTGMESFFTDAWNQGVQGVLSQTNKSWKEAGKTIVQSMILEMNKKSWTNVWDNAAKLLAPKPESTTGGVTSAANTAENTLGSAAKELQKGGIGLNSAGLQLATSAGGLLLSGIGIATNSEALVIAGTALQLAGFAIQLYQTLAATTTAVTMTAAASALTGSAGALSAAASMLMAVSFKQSIPIIGHTGLELPSFHLGSDEIPAVLQKGEWVINKDAVGALRDTYGPGAFKMFNSGRVPAVPVVTGSSGGNQVTFKIGKGAINIIAPPRMTDREAENMVRRQILPAIEKVMGNRALSLLE